MNKYSIEELMIPQRKEAEKMFPKSGELLQGMFFSIFKAMDYFDSAIILFNKNQPAIAVSLFVSGIEELSKAISFFELLFDGQDIKKFNNYQEQQKNHTWKLETILCFIRNLTSNKNSIFSFSFDPKSKRNFEDFSTEIKNLLKTLSKFINPKVAQKYHNLRMSISYTDFDGKNVHGPHHDLKEVDLESYKILVRLLKEMLDKLINFCEPIFFIYLKPIRERYSSSDKNRRKFLKQEINRRVNRTLPAGRQYIDKLLKEKFGISIIDSMNSDEQLRKLKNSIEEESKCMTDDQKRSFVKEMWKKIISLITCHEQIEEIYFYPPLKDKAKVYYSQFNRDKKVS